MSNDADEDDYMSADFLASGEDHRPGLVLNRATKRKYEAEKRHWEANRQNRTKSTKQLMEDTRSEALSKPLGEENKGFNLLRKMGFKPGMGLGRESNADKSLKEPIPIVVRTSRGGLGQEAEAKERIEARLKTTSEAECNRMAQTFRDAKRSEALVRQAWSDLGKSQRACHQLDLAQDLEEPEQPWFWPPKKPKDQSNGVRNVVCLDEEVAEDDGLTEGDTRRRLEDSSDEDEEVEEEKEEEDPCEMLKTLTSYLRERHHYCIWCAIHFDGDEDMAGNCPGPTREEHDED
ncbi:hypothetical protein HPB47_012303 [Ixodes persulcatus]|uniref:Uncharacterized protein n=1 Tax=Ixodes persulcatus TaxID=34615 RepID=A0AC60NU63_IXOPE|nr:hypothetical protein HPB47_012303 [Ixodes persulcatus]